MKRAVRIGGASGAASDRREGFAQLASAYPDDPVDVLIGDFMSEGNMAALAARKAQGVSAYEFVFVDAITPALADIAKYGIKVVVNAGASDTELLHGVVVDLVKKHQLALKVAWVSGDEVFPAILERTKADPQAFLNVHTGEPLSAWPFKPFYAQAYLGGLGIAAALQHGADIVICGRVSDPSLVVGAAAWWHNWDHTHLPELANALIAGHLIECSTYVTGGNFSGFKELEEGGRWLDLGYPIAEIGAQGEVVITKQKGRGGIVSVGTCTAQLLYEIQGPWYFNSDVTAILDNICFTQIGDHRVSMTGVESAPPPPTTKVGITAPGGFQAEAYYFLTGLDAPAKARLFEQQARYALRSSAPAFTLLSFQLLGTPVPNARTQDAATAVLRVVAQAPTAEALAPELFARRLVDLVMSVFPGGTFHLDLRMGAPRPVYAYFVTRLAQTDVKHRVHTHDGAVVEVPPPKATRVFGAQPSAPRFVGPGVTAGEWGETMRAPLGLVVHARSGDKGSDSNVGFFVSGAEEFEWLRRLLSVDAVKELLAGEYNGKQIDRFELPHIRAVHFLLHDHLDRGVNCTSSVDFLGKNVAEFLRAREVDVPRRFLKRTRDGAKL
ncbi:hypothetical protein DFH08DRAFT_46518 [Mycena albidolilacea]|uniref:DUF1446-domain-containing protein n=1 Tax=Mycena albidolilacea TaxID=1033008 RepID=A0AAD7ABW9_9AGAR|nr:hypothetical protein DFH08DRAFT_46518 [Mycena albidolilacea]